MKNNNAALVIGLCSHGLSITRALASKGIDVFCIEKDFSLPGTKTNKCREIIRIENYESECLLKFLKNNTGKFSSYDHVVLFPSNDKHVKFITENIDKIPSLYKVSWSNCTDTIGKLLEKKNIESASLEKNLNYPNSRVFSCDDIPLTGDFDFSFPTIIKPNAPLSSFKTEIAKNINELKEILVNHKNESPLLVQEYVRGADTSIYFCALIYKDGVELSHLCGRKIKSYPLARGQTTIAETVIADDVYEVARKFFSGLNITGPVSLEIKKDPDGKIWIIEPTVGRTDFWSELCIAAGFNLPYIEYCIATESSEIIDKNYTDIMWYDSEKSPTSYFEDIYNYKKIWPKGKKPVFSYFKADDIKPFLTSTKQFIINHLHFKP
jgi:predicted ATP-grasp superfamily ATP-dependent carboligase